MAVRAWASACLRLAPPSMGPQEFQVAHVSNPKGKSQQCSQKRSRQVRISSHVDALVNQASSFRKASVYVAHSTGMAWVYDKYSRGHENLYPLQQAARQARRGLWAQEAVPPWEWRRESRARGKERGA